MTNAKASKLAIPWVPEDEWASRTDPLRPYEEALFDPVWRVANLYTIKDRKARVRPFRPTQEQRVIIWDIHVRGLKALMIPKARKLGMSTVLCIIMADMVAWESGVEAAIIDKTQADGESKLANIVKFAIDSMDASFRSRLTSPDGFENKSTVGFVVKAMMEAGGLVQDIMSSVKAGVSFRGGTPQFLLVSEWATIQFDHQKRSSEIKTGAMEAARDGIRAIETTWKGGKGGHVWPYVKQALEIPEDLKTPQDWRLRFFPWWVDPANRRPGNVARVDKETNEYLDEMEKELGIKFDDEQRLWYWHQKIELGIFMKRENPTTLAECWQVPIEGAIYAKIIETIRSQRRITVVPYDVTRPVFTSWDLGAPENTVVWYIQVNPVNEEWDVIDCDGGLDLETRERVAHMMGKGYQYAAHFLPHDAAAVETGGQSFQQQLSAAGLENIRVVPRTLDKEIGINIVSRLLLRCRFDSEACDQGLEGLSSYRAKVDEAMGWRTELIVHDWASHYADALRTMAEAKEAGMMTAQGGRRFDHTGLAVLDDRAKVMQWKTGDLTLFNGGVTFTESASGWAWIKERPARSRLYLVGYCTIGNEHGVVVGRVLPADENDDDRIEVVAVMNPVVRSDQDIILQRLKAVVGFYGNCPVVLVSDKLESTAKQLRDGGLPHLWTRPRLGAVGKQVMVPGFEPDSEMAQPISELAAFIREQSIEVFHEDVRRQLSTFVVLPDGSEGPAPGSGQIWVRALAGIVHARAASSPYSAASIHLDRQSGLAAAVLAPQPKPSTS